jgi:hypothetical protein
MSLLTETVRQIAVLAERRNQVNIPGMVLATCEPYPRCQSVLPEDLNGEQIELVTTSCNSKPKLSLAEIEELLAAYRFHLPQEAYDFYQLGNGCLPIGVSAERDWESIFNYFHFPNMENSLWTLAASMDAYCNGLIDRNPRLLPICAYEDESALFIVGGEEQRETGSLVWAYTYNDDVARDVAEMEVVWPSLTNMMLAYSELYEGLSQPDWTKSKKEMIYQKYSASSEEGWYRFSSFG